MVKTLLIKKTCIYVCMYVCIHAGMYVNMYVCVVCVNGQVCVCVCVCGAEYRDSNCNIPSIL